jgi:hypothetical protein
VPRLEVSPLRRTRSVNEQCRQSTPQKNVALRGFATKLVDCDLHTSSKKGRIGDFTRCRTSCNLLNIVQLTASVERKRCVPSQRSFVPLYLTRGPAAAPNGWPRLASGRSGLELDFGDKLGGFDVVPDMNGVEPSKRNTEGSFED